MNKSKNLVFFGNERLSSGFQPHGAPTLQALINHGYDVRAIVANYETGQSRNARTLEIEAVAKQRSIPVLLPNKPEEIIEQLASYQPAAGVLVAYGQIIPQSVIDLFPHGILNIHPSLLPQYRGPTPIEQALLDGAPKTGVSIMQLVKKMDAGPVFAWEAVTLSGSESKQELTDRLLNLGSQLLLDVLPDILDGSATPTAQDETKATYTSLIQKSDGLLDLSKPAEQLERQIRAYANWPKSRATLFGHDVVISKARIAKDASDGVLVLTCNPGWLEVMELRAPSGRSMSGADFTRGYKKD